MLNKGVNGLQKSAILLISLGSDISAEILKRIFMNRILKNYPANIYNGNRTTGNSETSAGGIWAIASSTGLFGCGWC